MVLFCFADFFLQTYYVNNAIGLQRHKLNKIYGHLLYCGPRPTSGNTIGVLKLATNVRHPSSKPSPSWLRTSQTMSKV